MVVRVVTGKRNVVYFEDVSMRGLSRQLDLWQDEHQRQLLSVNIQRDGDSFCCIALIGPVEVLVTSEDGQHHAKVTRYGNLSTR